jgi:hypothetical protein
MKKKYGVTFPMFSKVRRLGGRSLSWRCWLALVLLGLGGFGWCQVVY